MLDVSTYKFFAHACHTMTDTSDEYKRFILELIDLYASLPALWDITCKDYSNRTVKEQKYDILLEKFREKHPNGDKVQLKKKINGLRTNYRRELKRVRDQEKNGNGLEAPALYYFEAFHDILKKFEEPDSEDLEYSQSNSLKKSKPAAAPPLPPNDSNEDEDLIQLPKKKKLSNSNQDSLLKISSERLKTPKNSQQLLAAVWSDKLSRMKRNQRIVAEKLINDIMFNGELGLLNFNTRLSNLKQLPVESDLITENSMEYDSDSGDVEEEFKIEFVED